ncbi:GNAT family N-acetyltransferase [Marinibacterium sp. SX1]|uniref:GNAT family N-acetyltransferase n=1 Tax=Marinibacterium sp. SX1 TaxID=3388424 RepID=UPI003D164E17
MGEAVTIARMGPEDLALALDWAAAEGWNPGLDDGRAFLAADPHGFFTARVGGRPVAAISVVNHGPGDAFLGLYICHPDLRGQGIGLRLWREALQHAGDRSVGLDGVPAQEANYERSGFVRVGASLRHEGRVEGRQTAGLRRAGAADVAALVALDGAANGYARPAFLGEWVAPREGLRETIVMERDGEIAGFATWRACRAGTKIGPVIAPDTGAALALIGEIAAQRPDGPLIIDLPEANTALRGELERAGFQVPFATARMFRGRVPQTGPDLQAIGTMELG